MNHQSGWYIVQQPDGSCEIVPSDRLSAPDTPTDVSSALPPEPKQWGPYPSPNEAIARRVGLIRSGHCKPR